MRHWLAHFFVPRHTNNHRAKALHVDTLLFYALAIVALNFFLPWFHRVSPNILGYAIDIRVEQLLAETNEKRKENGLSELTLNDQLSQAAAGKAADMFANDYWAHTSPQGKLPWDFIVNSGYTYMVAGENLAKNFSDSDGVVAAWMESPSHRDNVLKSSYKEVGFAVVNGVLQGEETTLVVQMFGSPKNGVIAKAQAQEPAPTPAVVAQVPLAAQEEVETTVPALAADNPGQNLFAAVVSEPVFDITSVKKNLTLLFVAFLLGVLALDAYLVARHGIMRVSGRSAAHVLFFVVVLIILSRVVPGVVL